MRHSLQRKLKQKFDTNGNLSAVTDLANAIIVMERYTPLSMAAVFIDWSLTHRIESSEKYDASMYYSDAYVQWKCE